MFTENDIHNINIGRCTKYIDVDKFLNNLEFQTGAFLNEIVNINIKGITIQ